ncbi:MAG TPA: mechanosensitive ion channel family protein [Burkholderiaceae bacterium]
MGISFVARCRQGARALAALAAVAALHGIATAQPAASAAAAASAPTAAVTPAQVLAASLRDQTVVLSNRPIVTFRAPLLGRSARERALAGNTAVRAVLDRDGPGEVTVWKGDRTVGLQIDGIIVLYLVPEDLDPGPTLDEAAELVRERLQAAAHEVREAGDLRRIGLGVARAVAATLIAYLLIRGAFALRRRAVARAQLMLDNRLAAHPTGSLASTYAHNARSLARALAVALNWAVVLVLIDLWATYVLRQFAFTRYWGERSTEWLLGLARDMASALFASVPGIVTAVIIFFIARMVTRANSALMQRVARGELQVAGLDRDTADPTRRIGNFVIWLFALAMAYPFLPGADSDAFKGVSVMAGLMISLGASSVVGQIMSGLSLMYSRSLRVGEFVKIGTTEGTVSEVGLFATKLHTGMGEEVSVPNSVVVGQPVQNYSRLAQGRFVIHTAVTIGYSTPWRQVHEMLLEAARRTPGVAPTPAPYVLQTALSDFYVEYRLCAQCNEHAAPRRADVMNQLHGHIQDVFNENGVQIMSPHYMADTAQPQVVPQQGWSPGIASPKTTATDGAARGR